MQRTRQVLAHCCWLAIVIPACQLAAPIAPSPPAGPTSTSTGAAAPTSAAALGIDLRVPPTRAPRASASPSTVATAVGASVPVTLADDG